MKLATSLLSFEGSLYDLVLQVYSHGITPSQTSLCCKIKHTYMLQLQINSDIYS